MTVQLTAEEAAIHDQGGEEGRRVLDEALARARRLSARAGTQGPFFDYPEVEVLHADGRVLAVVEADPWAPEQRELAARIFAAADGEDVVSREAATALVQAEYGDTRPRWCVTQHGTMLAERMGCWQAYASLAEQRRPASPDEEEDGDVGDDPASA